MYVHASSGIRVNWPGRAQRSTVRSRTRDTLTFKSIFDRLFSQTLRRGRVNPEFSLPTIWTHLSAVW